MKLCSIDGESGRRSNRLIKRQRCLGGSIVTCLSLFLSRSFECPFFSCPLFSHRVSDRESTGHQTWKRRVTASKICRVKGERSMVVSTRERNEDREGGERNFLNFCLEDWGDVSRRSWMEVKTNRDLYGARADGFVVGQTLIGSRIQTIN